MPANPAGNGHLIVIGASAGGVEALLHLSSLLPADLGAPVCVVQHVGAHPSILPDLLRPRCRLRVVHARDGMLLAPGTVFIAPPDVHMLVDGERIRLRRGPRENHTRPAIDPLLRSAALHWGPRAIGVILTGQMDDGTAGLAAIKACGGTAIVQDPASAAESSMPQSALDNVDVDHVVTLDALAPLLERLARAAAPAGGAPPELVQREAAINQGESSLGHLPAIAEPSTLTCPDCGGSLWEIRGVQPPRYRCHTGHAFSVRALEGAQVESGEAALWTAIRTLQERELLLRRMAGVSLATGDRPAADAGALQVQRLRARIDALIDLTEEPTPLPPQDQAA